MNLKKCFNISSFCSTDKSRVPLQYVHVSKERKQLEATDGRIAVRIHLKDEDLDGLGETTIPAKDWDKATKSAAKVPTTATINTTTGKVLITTEQSTTTVKPLDKDYHYPNPDTCYPNEKNAPVSLRIGLNAELLAKLSDYVLANKGKYETTPTIIFEFRDATTPVGFTCHAENNGEKTKVEGILMPVRLE